MTQKNGLANPKNVRTWSGGFRPANIWVKIVNVYPPIYHPKYLGLIRRKTWVLKMRATTLVAMTATLWGWPPDDKPSLTEWKTTSVKPHTLEGFLPILHELKEDHLFQCWRFTNDVQTNSSCKMLRHLPSIITKHQEYLRLSTLTAGEFVCFGEWRYPQIRFGHIMMFSFFQHGYFHELVSCTWFFFRSSCPLSHSSSFSATKKHMCHGQNMEYGMPRHRNASGLMTIPPKLGNIDQFTQVFIMVHGTLMVATWPVGEMLANQENACLFLKIWPGGTDRDGI